MIQSKEIQTLCIECKRQITSNLFSNGIIAPFQCESCFKKSFKTPEPEPEPEEVTIRCWDCGKEVTTNDYFLRTCPECTAKTSIGAAKTASWGECMENLYRSICPPLYQATQAELLPDKKMLQFVMNWDPKSSKGILLHGETGSGKTRVLWLLFKQLIYQNRKIKHFSAGFSDVIQSLAFDQYGQIEPYLKEIERADIVFFDELGKYNFTETFSERFFRIIEYRAAHLRPTFATTNITGDYLSEKMGRNNSHGAEQYQTALIRRLRDFFEIYPGVEV